MREIEFVEKAVSHIENKNERETAKTELSDHILSAEEFYCDIGYNGEEAQQKAQQRMGDADVIGEQLNAACIKNKSIKIMFTVFSFLGCLLTGLAVLSMPDGEDISFYNFCFVWCVFLINLLLLFLTVKKRSFAGVIFSSVSAASICFFQPYYITNLSVLLLRKMDVAKNFYISEEYFNAFNDIQKADSIISFVLFETAILLCAGLAAFVILRIKKLKNSIYDLKAINICALFLLALFIISAGMFGTTALNTVRIKNSIVTQTRKELVILDKAVIDNAEAFFTDDFSVYSEKLIKSVGDDAKVTKVDDGKREKHLEILLGGARLYYVDNDGDIGLYVQSNLRGLNREEFEIFTRQEQLEAREYRAELHSVPFPCLITMSNYIDTNNGDLFSNVSKSVKVYYSSASPFEENSIEYEYNNSSLEYQISDFLFMLSGEDAQLTEEQEKKLDELLINEFYDNKIYDKYFKYDKAVYKRIYGTSYNSELDKYQIDMYLSFECAAIINEKLFVLNSDYSEIASITVSFKKGKAYLEEFWTPLDGSYYPKSIKARFSDTAYNNWENDSSEYYYPVFEAKRIEKRYNQKVCGEISSVSDDGVVMYYKYTDDYSNYEDGEYTMTLEPLKN